MIEIDQAFVDSVIRPRDPETNKNDYGRILCVCGSAGYTGAAYFAAQGAVRMGSGVVTLAVPERAWPVLAVKLNEPVAHRTRGRAAHRLRYRARGRGDGSRMHAASKSGVSGRSGRGRHICALAA